MNSEGRKRCDAEMCDESIFSDECDVPTGNECESGIGQQHRIAKNDFRLAETVPHGNPAASG